MSGLTECFQFFNHQNNSTRQSMDLIVTQNTDILIQIHTRLR